MMLFMFIFFTLSAFADPYLDSKPWWDQTSDKKLQELVYQAITDAPDSKIALERAKQSYALAQQSKVGFLPSVSVGWSSNTQPQEALGFGFGLSSLDELIPDIPGAPVEEEEEEDDKYTLFTSGTTSMQVNLPLDIWGKAIRNYQASVLDAENAQHQRTLTIIALSQNVALAYWDIAVLEAQRKLLEEQINSIQGLLEVTTLRQKRGEGTSIDVLQQKQQLLALQANMPVLDFQWEMAHQRLAVLLGKSPTQHIIDETEVSENFEISPPSQIDVTKNRRPDLRIAEQSLLSATKKLEVSQREFLPSLGLGGQVYRQSNLQDGEWDSIDAWSISSSLSLNLYQGGSKVNAVQGAKSSVYIAEQSLVQAKIRAEQEIQGAISNFQLQDQLVDARQKQSDIAQKTYKEARASYIQGISPLFTVLTSQQAYQQSQSAFIQSKRDFLAAQLQLIAALGGDWTKPQNLQE
jgi:outer membrane protein, multidrug efflux system